MTTRKVLSISSTYDGYNFPDLPLQQRPVIGVTTVFSSQFIYNEDGQVIGEQEIATEHDVFDESWQPEEPSIFLCVEGESKYFSIHPDYTITQLKSTIDPEEESLFNLQLHTKSSLGSDLTDKILETNLFVLNKYKEDTTYLNYLGIPEPSDPSIYFNNESDENIGIATT